MIRLKNKTNLKGVEENRGKEIKVQEFEEMKNFFLKHSTGSKIILVISTLIYVVMFSVYSEAFLESNIRK